MHRRVIIDKENFDVMHLVKIMRNLFPKKNDYATVDDMKEVLLELIEFNVYTKKDLRLLLKKYRRRVLLGEKEKLNQEHQKIFREIYGNEEYFDSLRRQYWFSYSGIIRTILEWEFGEDYEVYSNKRDGI